MKASCTLSIAGMDCPGCAAAIERGAKSLSGVDRVSVDFMAKTLTASGSGASPDRLIAMVKSLGYLASPIEGAADSATLSTDPSYKLAKPRTFLLGVAAIFVVLGGVGGWQGFPNYIVLPAILAAIAVAGAPLFRRGILAASRLRLDINFLMMAAAIGALFIGEWTEAGIIIVLFAFAELLEARSVDRSRRAVKSLATLTPRDAIVIRDGCELTVPTHEVGVGERIVVKPGGQVPVDGIVVAGSSDVNQAALTGESMPVFLSPGSKALAGTVNGAGALEIETTNIAGSTLLDRIIQLVNEAQAKKATLQRWVDKFSAIYTPIVVGLAVAAAIMPPLFFGAEWSVWIYRGLALLVIACPCALVISTPVTVVSALAAAARRGVLIKGGAFLENLHRARVVAFDKTGTITYGAPVVKAVIPLNGATPERLVSLAASMESRSEHPIAKALLDYAKTERLDYRPVENFSSIAGRGGVAATDGKKLFIGSHALFEELGICDGSVHEHLLPIEQADQSAVILGYEDQILGVIALSDSVRDDAERIIGEIKGEGKVKTAMLTGDNHRTSEAAGRQVGIDEVRSELLPHEKVEAVEGLRRRYGMTIMVGDGVNDAPALAAADVGIAMGVGGVDAALDSADVVLMTDALERIPWMMRLSRKAYRIIIANISAAIGIKLLFVGLAVTGNATLWMAVFADMGVSLMVIFNGMRALRCR